jgi:hypothetical protein
VPDARLPLAVVAVTRGDPGVARMVFFHESGLKK